MSARGRMIARGFAPVAGRPRGRPMADRIIVRVHDRGERPRTMSRSDVRSLLRATGGWCPTSRAAARELRERDRDRDRDSDVRRSPVASGAS